MNARFFFPLVCFGIGGAAPTQGEEKPVLYLPAELLTGATVGEGIDHEDINLEKKRRGKKAESIFADEYRKQGAVTAHVSSRSEWDLENFDSLSTITNSSQFALRASGKIGWVTAAAAVNRKKYEQRGKRIFESRIFMHTVTSSESLPLKLGEESVQKVLSGDVLKMIESMAAAQGKDLEKMLALQKEFRQRFGTGYLESCDKGAQYSMSVTQQYDWKTSVQSLEVKFKADTSALLSNTKVSAEFKKKREEVEKSSHVQVKGSLIGGPTEITQAGNVDAFVEYINKGKDPWIKAASERPDVIGAVFVPYSSIPQLEWLAYNPEIEGGGSATRIVGAAFQDDAAPPAYAFVQYAPSPASRRAGVVPVPRLVALYEHQDGLGFEVGFQVSAECLDESAFQERWNELLHEGAVDADVKALLPSDFRPVVLEGGLMTIKLRYGHDVDSKLQLTNQGATKERPAGMKGPLPLVEELKNKCHTGTGDIFYYTFSGTQEAVAYFKERLASGPGGIAYSPVVIVDGVDPVSVCNIGIEASKVGEKWSVAKPTLIEAVPNYEVIAKLQHLKGKLETVNIDDKEVEIVPLKKGDIAWLWTMGELKSQENSGSIPAKGLRGEAEQYFRRSHFQHEDLVRFSPVFALYDMKGELIGKRFNAEGGNELFKAEQDCVLKAQVNWPRNGTESASRAKHYTRRLQVKCLVLP